MELYKSNKNKENHNKVIIREPYNAKNQGNINKR